VETKPLGSVPTFTVTFLDDAGVAYEPTTVTLTLRSPSGALTTPANVAQGDGVYTSVVQEMDEAGIWRWRWEGEGPGNVVSEGGLCVTESMVA
jgi:hypothetical protein